MCNTQCDLCVSQVIFLSQVIHSVGPRVHGSEYVRHVPWSGPVSGTKTAQGPWCGTGVHCVGHLCDQADVSLWVGVSAHLQGYLYVCEPVCTWAHGSMGVSHATSSSAFLESYCAHRPGMYLGRKEQSAPGWALCLGRA